MSPRSEKNKAPKLEDFCSITSSKRIYAADYVEDGIPFVRGKEVVQRFFGSGPLESELFISPTKFETLRDRFGAPTAGDLLLTSVGTLGVPYLVTDGDEFYFKDGNLIWFRSFDGLNSKFFYYWIRSRAGRAQLAKCTIGTSQAAYTIERLKEVEAPKHSIAQQERIADILSAYDDLIENNRRRITLLEEEARLLYREWFVHLRFPGYEHVNIDEGLPEGWERRTLGDIAEANKESYRAKELPDEINYIDISSVAQGRVVSKTRLPASEAPGRARRKIRYGDIIWSNVRPNLRAYALMLEPEELDVVSTGFTVLTATRVPFTWLYMFVTTDNFVGHLINHATGVGYPAVRPDDFERAGAPIPSRMLLDQFHEVAEPSFRLICKLDQQSQKLAEARDLLLPRLMNGELAV